MTTSERRRVDAGATPIATRPSIGFVLEQSLGHVTHGQNLMDLVARDASIEAHWRLVDWETGPLGARLPVYRSNWTVRAGLRARRAIRDLRRTTPVDALFVHTQVPAVLAQDQLRRIPTVVSVDATPLQYDELGASYQHGRGPEVVERLKWHANRSCFRHAAHLVSWSRWARDGLVADYDVSPGRVTVLAPGVDVDAWDRPADQVATDDVVRILFVGGDLDRKGGQVLLDGFQRLHARGTSCRAVELHLVTSADVVDAPGVVVHRGLRPNSPELKALYHRADVFCLPTRGDCLPMVLSEAGAAGLPLVSTDVGAVGEIVRDGETGLLAPVDDVAALERALARLVDDDLLRRRLGRQARELVRRDFNADTNARRLVELLREVAAPAAARRAGSGEARVVGSRVLLTVSGEIAPDVRDQVRRGERPRPDYQVMAEAMDADLLDLGAARDLGGTLGRVVERLAGPFALLAWASFRLRGRYATVFTDGEQVGLPFAALCRVAGRRKSRHVMIGHLLSVPAKVLLFRLLRLGAMIDKVVVYATAQQQFAQDVLGLPPSRTVLSSFMVDTAYFAPTPPPTGTPVICSAGLEYRDYPTLIEAVRGLDVDVVLAAASPWSARGDSSRDVPLPDNVRVCRLGFADLRDLYARSRFVVVPLEDVPFQAGVTTILEAMAMGRAVVCTRTVGQTDVVVDGQTGRYVPPGDVAAMRTAIRELLDDPDLARRMGEAGRRMAVHEMEVTRYAARLAEAVGAHGDVEGRPRGSRRGRSR